MARPKTRAVSWTAIAAQAALLALVAALVWLAADTALGNMRARGLASGFAFLDRPAGFDIAQSLIPYAPTDTNRRVFVVGALNTLLVASLGIVLATGLGLLAGVGRRSRSPLLRGLATAYVELARNTPLPIQLLVWYSVITAAPPPRAAIPLFGVGFLCNRGLYLPGLTWSVAPGLVVAALLAVAVATVVAMRVLAARRRTGPGLHPGFALAGGGLGLVLVCAALCSGTSLPRAQGFGFEGGWEVSPALLTLVLGLGLYTGGYIAEVVRGGLDAVAPGQGEAARALGLSGGRVLTLVTLPQALRVMVPPLISQYLNLLKNSSLAVVVGYPDLVATFGGTTLNQTGQAIETLSLVLLFYLTLSIGLSAAVNAWSRRQGQWAAPR